MGEKVVGAGNLRSRNNIAQTGTFVYASADVTM